jgi:hypothetical protein
MKQWHAYFRPGSGKETPMDQNPVTRRDFGRLTMAAVGGIAAGVMVPATVRAADEGSLLLKDPHVCRGLNTCKGKGTTKDNACAGQGKCATAEKHTCDAQNACKGQGGCGETPGENACKTKGSCHVPLTPDTWKKARAHFEAAMKKAGKSVGPAPAA